MYPLHFGRDFWNAMLEAALNFPDAPTDEQKTNMVNWLTFTMKILPCPGCAVHGFEYVLKNPPDVTSGKTLIFWIVTFHNFVNEKLNKKQLTLQEALADVMAHMLENTHHSNKRSIEIAMANNVVPGATATSNNETLYFWLMIALAVTTACFLTGVIILLIQKRSLQQKLRNTI
jgi:hypothetical protein